jgi:hypothetical protein
MSDIQSNPSGAPPSAASAPLAVSSLPQFATAEYAHIPGTERCKICSNLLTTEYYRINGLMACANCAQQSLAGQPSDSHVAYARGLLFGVGGSILGLILYATVRIATGWTIVYLSLAVGWLVGKGMIKGSNGLGGRRYQIAALILTYAAISLAEVPVIISLVIKGGHTILHWGPLLQRIAVYAIASPFLGFARNPFGAAIGLFILFIGLRVAWTMTAARPLAVDGPYPIASR